MDLMATEALLGRPTILIGDEPARSFFRDKNVLVTGAAGSVGGALATQLAQFSCKSLILADHFDHGLLQICEDLHRMAPSQQIVELLCDIRDRGRLERSFERAAPDVVIHAAALKHVHLGERHPVECLLTNLIGTRNAVEAAQCAGASHFVLVSTDKAASPVCVMGASKRLAELYLAGVSREGGEIDLKSVRFGNVFGSQGSVVPRFEAQIAAGGPVEVTHPAMERYFMTAEEAVRLILQVAATPQPRESSFGSYFLDMGAPLRIVDLARRMIDASEAEASIIFTGLREGEKLSEELFDDYETVEPSPLAGVHKVTPASSDAWLSTADVAQLEAAIRRGEEEIARQHVFGLLDARLGRQERMAG